FTVELSFNFISNFFWVFVKDAWNYLDALVVAVSWVSLALPEGGVGTIKVVRLLRVFRVIRVIKRFKSLRRIVKALLASVIPVSYSLMLLLLATAMFAVVAVDTMAEDEPVPFARSPCCLLCLGLGLACFGLGLACLGPTRVFSTLTSHCLFYS
ncbi:MAG: ion transporter, partial [Promethearchaeia archaeon]